MDTHFLGIALGAREARLSAAIPDANNLGHTVFYEDAAGDVRAVPRDSLLLNEPIKFIKVDVEGMELDILSGLDQTIGRWRPTIFIEVWDDKQIELLDWCVSNSYEVIEQYQRYPGIRNYLIRPVCECDVLRRLHLPTRRGMLLCSEPGGAKMTVMSRASSGWRERRSGSGLTGRSR